MSILEGWLDDHFRPRILLKLVGIPDPFPAVIDTAFNDSLWLPLRLTEEAGVTLEGRITYTLADGRREVGYYFNGYIQWFGSPREIRVVVAHGEDALLGAALLRECLLEVNFPSRTVKLSR